MNRRVRRGLLYITAAVIMLGTTVYVAVLPFVTDSISDINDS